MSTIEQAVPRAASTTPHFVRRRGTLLRRVLLLTLLGWTAYWTTNALHMIRAYSRIGAGAAGATVDGHEIFELIFVASHCLVRWAPLAVLFTGALLWSARAARRAQP